MFGTCLRCYIKHKNSCLLLKFERKLHEIQTTFTTLQLFNIQGYVINVEYDWTVARLRGVAITALMAVFSLPTLSSVLSLPSSPPSLPLSLPLLSLSSGIWHPVRLLTNHQRLLDCIYADTHTLIRLWRTLYIQYRKYFNCKSNQY